ncbi:uncharacterized protein MYCFIDRAFT_80483 [Pseudocercospora fijiensis CIRAD86]|uniref:Uncharacterized protein n=1 Tax=Pseudocercospora fijiensis (strain CIRAD86) TaxID=383855 RepID=M2ZV67_PSEFD|nr:uncharacterized protein MYCFIDRAFT_80483 [Pseudocercospora fijiensis CIRAD86]EME82899.1 hypothetical protein MYCFIDRAFT_80483 [Pseudocercospora fijiensis CIRAD86]
MAEKKEFKGKGCLTLQKRSGAYLEYEDLTELPQHASLAELDKNGYPVLHMGERFCRLPGKDGMRICGLRFADYVTLNKHFTDAHEIDAAKKPMFQRGMNKSRGLIDGEVSWYENFMQSIRGSQKRKADPVAPEVVNTPKSKKLKQIAALPASPSPLQQLTQPAATPVPEPSSFPAVPPSRQLPSASLTPLTPGPIAIVPASAPQAPSAAPPKPAAIPQDQYTQTYIASYNNGWEDCEREYQHRTAELEAEKAAFERERAKFHALRTRFGGELKVLLREVEGGR